MARHKKLIYIPPEVIFVILTHVPPRHLIRCMCVCKDWNITIRSQEFIKAHHHRSMNSKTMPSCNTSTPPRTILFLQTEFSFRDGPRKYFSLSVDLDRDEFSRAVRIKQQPLGGGAIMLGYCNGLVCTVNMQYSQSSSNKSFVIWNPSIRRYKRIPFPPPNKTPYYNCALYGFGYDSINDDYKLVTFSKGYFPYKAAWEVKIYSLKSNLWKKIQEDLPACFNDYRIYGGNYGIHGGLRSLNSALHWLMEHKSDYNKLKVLSFDLANDKYAEFPGPPHSNNNNNNNNNNLTRWRLQVLEGYLCVCARFDDRVVVWIMKEYGSSSSWTRLCTIQDSGDFTYYKPLLFSDSREMLLLGNCAGYVLFWYDLEKGKIAKQVDTTLGIPDRFETAICVPTLRLLDGDPILLTLSNSIPSSSLVD